MTSTTSCFTRLICFTQLAFSSALLASLALLSPASAGTITTGTPIATSPGFGAVPAPIIFTLAPSNDNGVVENNVTIIGKRFDANGYIDIEFTVAASTGVTEYLVTEFVDNNTGLDWSNYTMELGFGTGGQFAPSGAGDGLDFDAPLYDSAPSSTAFGSVTLGEDILTFNGGTHGSGQQTYTFRIDVPNFADSATFTLRQTPTPVPEPATLALAGVALIGALCIRRRS